MHKAGKVSQWQDAKGYGFILPDDGSARIFLHVKSFRNGEALPRNGDRLAFTTVSQSDGRVIASDVYSLEKKATIVKNSKSKTNTEAKRHFSVLPVLVILLIGVGGVFVWRLSYLTFSNDADENGYSQVADYSRNTQANPKSNFNCEPNKSQCSQMHSCEEAIFYLQNCPNTQIDGDHDGIPCEDQLCGH